MKVDNTIVLCLVALSLFQCQESRKPIREDLLNRTNNDPITINIDPNKLVETKLSDLIDSYSYIKLESSDASRFAAIDKLVYNQDCFYILDIYRTKAIYCFYKDGEFISKLDREGRGPGEYVRPNDFNIVNNSIAVLDDYGKKILYYDLKFNFLKEVPYSFYCYSFAPLDEDITVHYLNYYDNGSRDLQYNILVMNGQSEIISKHFKMEKKKAGGFYYSFKRSLWCTDGAITFKPILNDTIYRISKSGISTKYFVKFDGYEEKQKLIEDMTAGARFTNSKLYHDYPGSVSNLVETQSWLFFSYMFLGRPYLVYYYKPNKYAFYSSGTIDDLKSGINGFPVGRMDDHFIYQIESHLFHSNDRYAQAFQKQFVEKNKTLMDLKFSTIETDNPILIISSMK